MIRKFAIQLIVGFVAFFITFFTVLSKNVWLVSLERAVYAFFLFFLVSFAVRWLFSFILSKGNSASEPGTHVDLLTPEDSDSPIAEDARSEADEEAFTPLAATHLKRPEGDTDPARIANIVRHLTDE